MRKYNLTHSLYKRITDGKVTRRDRKGGKCGNRRGEARGRQKKRERHNNYQGFVPIVSAHSPPLALEGPGLVARRRRLRRRAVRCSSSRLRFRQQQQHEPTTLVILRRGLPPKRDRSRGILPVTAAPGLICHPASRHTTPRSTCFSFYSPPLLGQNVTFEGKMN